LYLAKCTSYEAPHYAVFSIISLFHPSSVQTFSWAMFSNTLSLHARGQVSRPYKTVGNIIVLYISMFTLLGSRREDESLLVISNTSLSWECKLHFITQQNVLVKTQTWETYTALESNVSLRRQICFSPCGNYDERCRSWINTSPLLPQRHTFICQLSIPYSAECSEHLLSTALVTILQGFPFTHSAFHIWSAMHHAVPYFWPTTYRTVDSQYRSLKTNFSAHRFRDYYINYLKYDHRQKCSG
jgi:hypothetical protein